MRTFNQERRQAIGSSPKDVMLANGKKRVGLVKNKADPLVASPIGVLHEEEAVQPEGGSLIEPLTVEELLSSTLSEEKLWRLSGTRDLANVTSIDIHVDMVAMGVEMLGSLLPRLHSLSMDNSVFTTFRDFGTGLRNLHTLSLASAGVGDLDGIGSLISLRELRLPHNNLEDLAPLACHDTLQVLDVCYNKLATLSCVEVLGTCDLLYSLDLRHNPISSVLDSIKGGRGAVLQLIPQLRKLDASASTPMEAERWESSELDRISRLIADKCHLRSSSDVIVDCEISAQPPAPTPSLGWDSELTQGSYVFTGTPTAALRRRKECNNVAPAVEDSAVHTLDIAQQLGDRRRGSNNHNHSIIDRWRLESVGVHTLGAEKHSPHPAISGNVSPHLRNSIRLPRTPPTPSSQSSPRHLSPLSTLSPSAAGGRSNPWTVGGTLASASSRSDARNQEKSPPRRAHSVPSPVVIIDVEPSVPQSNGHKPNSHVLGRASSDIVDIHSKNIDEEVTDDQQLHSEVPLYRVDISAQRRARGVGRRSGIGIAQSLDESYDFGIERGLVLEQKGGMVYNKADRSINGVSSRAERAYESDSDEDNDIEIEAVAVRANIKRRSYMAASKHVCPTNPPAKPRYNTSPVEPALDESDCDSN